MITLLWIVGIVVYLGIGLASGFMADQTEILETDGNDRPTDDTTGLWTVVLLWPIYAVALVVLRLFGVK